MRIWVYVDHVPHPTGRTLNTPCAAAGPLTQLRVRCADPDRSSGRAPVRAFRWFVAVARFRSRQGQRHLSGEYWAATTAGHVIFESQLELARLMLADFDTEVAMIYAQLQHAGHRTTLPRETP